MKSSIGIFSNNLLDIKNKIYEIKSSLTEYRDFVIFSDFFIHNGHMYDQSIFSSFYMKFFPGKVIFLTEQDYNNYKDTILGEAILYELQQSV